jgi:hypothetical protein
MAGLPLRRVLGSDGAKLREGEPNQRRIGVPHLCARSAATVKPTASTPATADGNDGHLLLGAIGSPIRA